ncbi:hypothetical protein MJT46_001809 [Ovis ammon polii x Ovis aries]|nr:hypothetical protein MJT46_001809 [Ovis ammon polii x Ovis aries]
MQAFLLDDPDLSLSHTVLQSTFFQSPVNGQQHLMDERKQARIVSAAQTGPDWQRTPGKSDRRATGLLQPGRQAPPSVRAVGLLLSAWNFEGAPHPGARPSAYPSKLLEQPRLQPGDVKSHNLEVESTVRVNILEPQGPVCCFPGFLS